MSHKVGQTCEEEKEHFDGVGSVSKFQIKQGKGKDVAILWSSKIR